MVFGPKPRLFLPYLNFTITTVALVFQTTVLYPWHHELDAEFRLMKKEFGQVRDEFNSVKAEQRETLREFHEVKLRRIDQLEEKLASRGYRWFW